MRSILLALVIAFAVASPADACMWGYGSGDCWVRTVPQVPSFPLTQGFQSGFIPTPSDRFPTHESRIESNLPTTLRPRNNERDQHAPTTLAPTMGQSTPMDMGLSADQVRENILTTARELGLPETATWQEVYARHMELIRQSLDLPPNASEEEVKLRKKILAYDLPLDTSAERVRILERRMNLEVPFNWTDKQILEYEAKVRESNRLARQEQIDAECRAQPYGCARRW